MSASSSSTGSTPIRWSGGNDLLRLYLQDIGRVDLLTAEDEVVLSRLKREERQLAEDHPAIERLLCLEELQLREANHLSHWPTRQEWARAAEMPLQELNQAITKGYETWAGLIDSDSRDLQRRLREGRKARDRMIQANLRLVVAVVAGKGPFSFQGSWLNTRPYAAAAACLISPTWEFCGLKVPIPKMLYNNLYRVICTESALAKPAIRSC